MLRVAAAAARIGAGVVRGVRGLGDGATPQPRIDPELLAYLVCPLSRKRLRYEETTNQLINDELGIAYPIIDGIPNMIPQEAILIPKSEDGSKAEGSSQQ
ncbi:protein preY, mitochondrial-like [Hypanus sabinus]|uniref:protein preY, mitochondrial-like n=1 Tax=Hypanus sabinus TaxID=79690 RepID=UPI0028C47D50|nr:protein preY, mitochondrial-like [Hypanus sabinus]